MSRPATLALACALALASLGAHAATPIQLDAAQQQALAIRSGAPEAARELLLTQLPALVTPAAGNAEAVTAPYAGVVTWIGAYEGDSVRQGQVLARVQSREAMLLAGELTTAQSAAAAANAQAKRDASLHSEGIIAAARVEQSRAAASAANARLGELRAAQALAPRSAQRPGEYELRAPFAGRVLTREVELGQAIALLGMAFSIGRAGPVGLEIQIPESYRALLRPGLVVLLPDGTRGQVLSVGAAIDARTQSLKLRATAAGPQLMPGQRLAVNLALPAPAQTWKVPATAVTRSQAGATIYLHTAPGFVPVPVTVLGQTESALYVQARLPAQARIALGGALVLAGLAGGE